MKKKRLVRNLIQIITFCAFVLLVQSMATVGAVYFVEPFDYCYNRDTQIQNNGLSKAEIKADYFDIKMSIISHDGASTLQVSDYDDATIQIVKQIQNMVQTAYKTMMICFVVCLIVAIYWTVERRYAFLKKLAIVSLFVPIMGMMGLLLADKTLFFGLVAAIFGSRYATLFGEQSMVLSVLPKGIVTYHYFVYLIIWAIMTASVYVVYRIKQKHRRPHEF